MANLMDKIVALCKRRGFVYPSSEIYGGFAATYDYGPSGSLVLRNLQDIWLKTFIYDKENMHYLDGAIISHPKTWEASGHVEAFNDPLVEDKITHIRYRADKIIEKELKINTNNLTFSEMQQLIEKHNLKSPEGNPLTELKKFNLLVEVELGSVEGRKQKAYLRGETCQNIFIDYLNILNTLRGKLPFGVGQIGKVLRNEITTKQFILRTREFMQMETEYFVDPEDSFKVMDEWKENLRNFFTNKLGLDEKKLRFREIKGQEKSHYAKKQYDVEYQLTSGQWLELTPLNHRGDWDLSRHMKYSSQDFTYKDISTGREFIPNVIETSIGLDRLFYVLMDQGYTEDSKRILLKIKPSLASYKVAVFPLLANKEELVKKAKDVYTMLKKNFITAWDDRGNIGKRYFAQDEIGTPFCVTIDYTSLDDDTVTVRDRNTTKQERVNISMLREYLNKKL